MFGGIAFVTSLYMPNMFFQARFEKTTCCAGEFEAGAFPAMWSHLTRFYVGGPELADAWGYIAAAQPFAQVLFFRRS